MTTQGETHETMCNSVRSVNVDLFRFRLGEAVEKFTGDFKVRGVVVGYGITLAGKRRYMIELYPAVPGMIHIYSEENLRRVEE